MSEIRLSKDFGIYRIVNKLSNKFYIGSTTTNFSSRWSQHKAQLRKRKHDNTHLQRSWSLYGEENFHFEVVEVLRNRENVFRREQEYIEIFYGPNLYNIKSTVGLQKVSEKEKQESLRPVGRPSTNIEDQLKVIKYKINNSKASTRDIEKVTGVKFLTVYKILKKHGLDFSTNVFTLNDELWTLIDLNTVDRVLSLREFFPLATSTWIGDLVDLPSLIIDYIFCKYVQFINSSAKPISIKPILNDHTVSVGMKNVIQSYLSAVFTN